MTAKDDEMSISKDTKIGTAATTPRARKVERSRKDGASRREI